MTETQKSLLARRLREAAELQPAIEILREVLIGIEGIDLVAPPMQDLALPRLIDAGFTMFGQVHLEIMEDSRCHANVARVWAEKHHGLVGIGTGYALSDDGLWRQHSWGLRREGLLETTERRLKYFGILLQGEEADSFSELNLARRSGRFPITGGVSSDRTDVTSRSRAAS